MQAWKVCREGEATIFSYDTIEKDKALSKYISSMKFRGNMLFVEVENEMVEDFLNMFRSRGFNLERV